MYFNIYMSTILSIILAKYGNLDASRKFFQLLMSRLGIFQRMYEDHYKGCSDLFGVNLCKSFFPLADQSCDTFVYTI